MAQKEGKVIRAGLYGRTSTLNHGQDVNMQVAELKAVAKQRGWEVAGIYVDEGVSGSQESRPELDRLLADARTGKINLVCVWKFDRLGRSLSHLLGLLHEFAALGVEFISVRDSGIDTTTPQGRLLSHLLGAFCEFEKALIQERVKAGLDHAKSKGVVLGRPRRDFDIRAATALLHQGHGLKSIARILAIPRTTLRKHLLESGNWPLKVGVGKPG